MRALAKLESTQGLKLIEALVPTPGPGEVLVRVKRTAISHDTIHLDRWDDWAQSKAKPPVIIGSEYVGLVAAVGAGVHDFHTGEVVVGEPFATCGTCRNCLSGQNQNCNSAVNLGIDRDGACADYICVPQASLWHPNQRVPLEILACFTQLGRALRATSLASLLGVRVLVMGDNPSAGMVCALAKHSGAGIVVAATNDNGSKEFFHSLGAIHIIDTNEAPLKDLHAVEGFDLGIETSGSAAGLRELVGRMRHGGTVALLSPDVGYMPEHLQALVERDLTLRGVGARGLRAEWQKLSLAVQQGLHIGPAIRPPLPVGSFREGWDCAAKGELGALVLDWEN
jgi:threonine 3-dehydrogenase